MAPWDLSASSSCSPDFANIIADREVSMTTKGLIVVFVAATFGVASTLMSAQEVKPCALLKSAEVQAVASSQVSEGVPSFLAPTGTHVCEYKWTAKNFSPSLQVMVSDASKMFPGWDARTIKTGILGGPRGVPKNTTVVPGVAEAANYRADSPTTGSATAYLKGKILQVVYQGTDAPAKEAQVIGLLKLAASRL
jgi:hypothetical protein